MKSTKDNYNPNEIVTCSRCGDSIKAKEMYRWRDYIYCGFCIDAATEEYYKSKKQK